MIQCPNQDEFVQCLAGTSPANRIEEIFQHLDQCDQCREVVERIEEAPDKVQSALQVSSEDRSHEVPACQEMMQSVENLPLSRDGESVEESTVKPPKMIRDYELLEPLAEGGMGLLYRAEHTRLKRAVAVKLLATRRTGEKSAIGRFNREMEAVGKLEHANIVRALDAGEHEGFHYLVMELLDGMDARQIIKRVGTLSIGDACEIICQAAMGLHYAHKEGLVHRDVKPSNMMVTTDGTVKVLDLGLALLGGSDAEELTTSHLAVGSIDYMAPEQVDNSHNVDAKADVYGLGCALYHLLCGSPPFYTGANATLLQRLKAHATTDPPRLDQSRPDAPPQLVELMQVMLAKSPRKRPQSSKLVAKALSVFTRGSNLKKLVARAMASPASGPVTDNFATVVPEEAAEQPVEPTPEVVRRTTTQLVMPPDSTSTRRSSSLNDFGPLPKDALEITTERQQLILGEFTELVRQCTTTEAELREGRAKRDAKAREEYHGQRDQIISKFELNFHEVYQEYKNAREEATGRFESTGSEITEKERQLIDDSTKELAVVLENAKHDWQETHEKMVATHDENKDLPSTEFQEIKSLCETYRDELNSVQEKADWLLERRGCEAVMTVDGQTDVAGGRWKGQSLEQLALAIDATRQHFEVLRGQSAARFNERGGPLLVLLLAVAGCCYPAYSLLGRHGPVWIVAGAAAGCFVTFFIYLITRMIGRRQTLNHLGGFQQAIGDAKALLKSIYESYKTDAEQRQNRLNQQRESEINMANASWAKVRGKIKDKHDQRLREAQAEFHAQRKKITDTHERQLAGLDKSYPPRLASLEGDFETIVVKLAAGHRKKLGVSRKEFEAQWGELFAKWSSGIASFQAAVEQMSQVCDARFPIWTDIEWQAWNPASDSMTALRFGEYIIDAQKLDTQLPTGDDLKLVQNEFALPAVLSYPSCPSLLFEADGDGRGAAVTSLQNVMLRLLTSLPAGKVRFTIIDPVGLGQNFSMFMHLTDYDERLVTNRIWTESGHINQRLTDLTEHMENVIQKYLRNEFESIQQYNRHAGEVAEPFQILVIANFPANFTDEAARRLVSIASSGARCGVYTLISTDTKMKLPRNFDLADLEAHAATLEWVDGRFRWRDEQMNSLPLSLDEPPADDLFTEAVKTVGKLAKDSSRVEVPFQTVVLPNEHWWTCDSRGEIEVPLGRAGATKFQYMRLGKGTSQHVLMAGKTGSGKSTLLHALITNLAIYYSPHEIQFYLIDFKKGVEFKAYATCKLPHARVIAIESEREFGMSVLERLDAELRRRGDLFRSVGVQDIKGYRDANPDTVMPRVLLIIDEFQELFVTDDKISQDASLLLDRLVRQGRAFGIHVLLGSQTLAGAYSLARSTLGQMAVRVALQCSETDAHLILSEDNTAARLLNRPGEAIYNDANGLFEGNHPFQVVWLPDHEREAYLTELNRMATQRGVETVPPIVFEGNVAADPSENPLLRKLIVGDLTAQAKAIPRAWLGASVAIKDPTSADFRRQGGTNLLVVGQQEETAMGMLANCMISLTAVDAAQRSSHFPRFYLLDGSRPESPDAGFWKRFTSDLAIDAQVVTPRETGEILAPLSQEVNRRVEENDFSSDPVYLVIYNLSRFRDLRKADEFSFSMDDNEKETPDKCFSNILREGPAVGIHALVWSDSYNSTNRAIDRQSMNDIELRVLFQMSASDSSNLMDSPLASRLGVHRAIFYSQELGVSEKFRPYGPPSDEWLAWVQRQFDARV